MKILIMTAILLPTSWAFAGEKPCPISRPLASIEAADHCFVSDPQAEKLLKEIRSDRFSDQEKGDMARNLAAKFPNNIYLQALGAALYADAGQVMDPAEERQRQKAAVGILAGLLDSTEQRHPYLAALLEREYLYHSRLYEALYLAGQRKTAGLGKAAAGIGASEYGYQLFVAGDRAKARLYGQKSLKAWLVLVDGNEERLIGNEYYSQALALTGESSKAMALLQKSIQQDSFRTARAYWFDIYEQRFRFLAKTERASRVRDLIGSLPGLETMEPFLPRPLQLSWEMGEEPYEACKKDFYQQRDHALEITYRSDGLKIFGILALPESFDPRKKYPTIIYNHGGNRDFGGLTACSFKGLEAKYTSKGYVVIASQFRGVMGSEGKDEVGGKDVRDVLRLEEITAQLPFVEPEKLFMIGGSRGAGMTFQALAQGSKVKAAVAIAGVSDAFAESKRRPDYEQMVLAEVVPDYWNQRESELKKRSPIHWPEKLNTPLLLIHGTNDWRVAEENSMTLYGKLKEIGKPVHLILHEGAGHDFAKAGDIGPEILQWLEGGYKAIR